MEMEAKKVMDGGIREDGGREGGWEETGWEEVTQTQVSKMKVLEYQHWKSTYFWKPCFSLHCPRVKIATVTPPVAVDGPPADLLTWRWWRHSGGGQCV